MPPRAAAFSRPTATRTSTTSGSDYRGKRPGEGMHDTQNLIPARLTFVPSRPTPLLVSQASPPHEEIALFRSLFRGREDVYPRRFESRQTGRTGCQPASTQEWVRGVCDKPRTKRSDCLQRRLLLVTDDVIPTSIGIVQASHRYIPEDGLNPGFGIGCCGWRRSTTPSAAWHRPSGCRRSASRAWWPVLRTIPIASVSHEAGWATSVRRCTTRECRPRCATSAWRQREQNGLRPLARHQRSDVEIHRFGCPP